MKKHSIRSFKGEKSGSFPLEKKHISWNGKDLDLKANQLSALMAIRRDFSDYVSLGLNFLLIRPDDKANYEGQSFHRTAQNFNLGGTFEFLF